MCVLLFYLKPTRAMHVFRAFDKNPSTGSGTELESKNKKQETRKYQEIKSVAYKFFTLHTLRITHYRCTTDCSKQVYTSHQTSLDAACKAND